MVGNYGSGYVTNPPNDGQTYGRNYNTWVPISGSGGSQQLSLSVDSNSADISIVAGGSGLDTISIPLATNSVAGLLSPSENFKLLQLQDAATVDYETVYWDGSSWEPTPTLKTNNGVGVTITGTLGVTGAGTFNGDLGVDQDLQVALNVKVDSLSGVGTENCSLDATGQLVRTAPAAQTSGVEALIDELVTQGVFGAGVASTLKASL